MKEFPKALYKGGQTGECINVEDEDQEAQARADGFVSLTDKPSRKPKETASNALSNVPLGQSTALVDPVLTTMAAEKPEDGNIYATTGSAPSKDFPIDGTRKTVEKTTNPVDKDEKKKG